jgi:putative transposase
VPAKNSVKEYIPNGCYHIYNRGVEKRDIFLDPQDFGVFLSYLKAYLLPKDLPGLNAIIDSKETTIAEKDKAHKLLRLKNFYENIDLLAYVLMPNHFHLLVRQMDAEAIDAFLNALSTRYVIYFNKKYHRVGPLYQGVYKAVLVNSENQLLHLTRYIHKNPPAGSDFPSSLSDYLRQTNTSWLKAEEILSYFSKTNPANTYSAFMNEGEDGQFIAPVAIDANED